MDIPAVSMPIARSLNLTSVALCCVTQLPILEWPFMVPSTRSTCVMIMLFNQLHAMLHLSGGWIILSMENNGPMDQHFTCRVYIFVQCKIMVQLPLTNTGPAHQHHKGKIKQTSNATMLFVFSRRRYASFK